MNIKPRAGVRSKAPTPLEYDEQVAFLDWFERQYPHIRIFAIPNGTRAHIRAAIKAKKEGVKSGVPDLYIPAWKIWIEMKRVKGSTISKEQKDWINYLETIGDTCIIGYGWQDAIKKLKDIVKV